MCHKVSDYDNYVMYDDECQRVGVSFSFYKKYKDKSNFFDIENVLFSSYISVP